MNFTKDRKIHGETNVQLKGRKTYTDLMFMLGLKDTMHLFGCGKQCLLVWSCVEEREDDHILRRALDFVVEGQRKKGRPKRTCNRSVEDESMKVGSRREDVHCRSKWSVSVNKIAAGLR